MFPVKRMESSNRSKCRNAINGYPPSLIICQVGRQIIYLVADKHINKPFNISRACKITGYIQHEPPVTKIWPILYQHILQWLICTVIAEMFQSNIGIEIPIF